MRLLMVCLGNICRSPLAEGIMKNRAAAAGLDWEIDSAGTGGYHIGEAPHVLSQKVAMCNGIDISAQQCRQFRKEDIDRFDRILVMDLDNYLEVKRISGNNWAEDKVSLLLDTLYPGEKKEVPDPWYGTEKDYHLVFDMIDRACGKLIDTHLKRVS
ncbi:low molecular weight protein-tyrosine-phosphatase [Sediminibacterium soli]|uniref:low molecular weight protein-tyrosine-phosphatase n=1 Tax=Sediminibacterium soli TaxID=2698829 RepID=UPI00137B8105|nr:low molecular weight protein-tyrosine-phosphatase [Sediminibacterium soli]NCI47467.1 low molecular weight phosphotyrosine protein phosphatase [Sediminibacterium soli]